jgi:translation initiation factor 2 beta subunit (eIF-2beta)/eIF-5
MDFNFETEISFGLDNNTSSSSNKTSSSGDKTFYFASKESSLSDPGYRYKYYEPEIEIIGKKGNRTTFFKNSDYYAQILKIPSQYFSKYIGGRLSCSSSFDSVKNCETFKGEFTTEQIKTYLIEFIKNYSLCEQCDLPETYLKKNEKKCLIKHCKGCENISIVNCKNIDKAYDFIDKQIKFNNNY